MREKLEKDITTRFGAVYGSKKLAEQRNEIVTNALDRYDEEIQNGATPEDAYNTAMLSVGDMRVLRKSLGADHRHKRICIYIFALGLPSLLLLVFAATLHWNALIPVGIGLAILLTAIIHLITKNYYSSARPLTGVIIGGLILFYCLPYITIFHVTDIRACIIERNAKTYDFAQQADGIESVSFVRITELHYGEEADSFRYTVYETLDDAHMQAALSGLSDLRYMADTSSPREQLFPDNRGLLIVFSDDSENPAAILYTSRTVAFIQRTEAGQRFVCHRSLYENGDWSDVLNACLIEDYGNGYFFFSDSYYH